MIQPSLLLLVLLAGLGHAEEGLLVQTASGPVRGYRNVSRAGKEYSVFAGIPFAKPPLGELRFMYFTSQEEKMLSLVPQHSASDALTPLHVEHSQPPQPVEPWKEVRDALEHGPTCPQVNIYFNGPPAGDEDCLYLTVYTRKVDGKAPVMVHLHGGAWILGEGPRAKSPENLMDEDIVVVDLNFRLGILGFLSFEDSDLPGNMGLKDQTMVLKWVKDNIKNFGGDPDQVTLMGECTGGDAVYHHMLSPLSVGLFHRAIAESGSSFTVQAVTPPGVAKERAARVADMMGCKGNTKEIVKCLQTKEALELASKLTSFIEWQIDPDLSFAPVFEKDSPDAFLTGPVSKWVPPKVPLLTGITSGEGLLRTMFFTHDFDFSKLNNEFNTLMPVSLMIKDSSSKPDEMIKKIKDYYLPGNSISMNDFDNLTDMYGDGWFSYGTIEGAKFSQGDVYMYYFDYVGQVTMSQFFGDRTKAKGAFHTDEALYLWQFAGLPQFSGKCLQVSKDLVKMFTNFIIKGNPTPDKEFGVTWTPYNPGENYLAIRNSGYTMEKGLLTDRYNFWKALNHRDKLM